MTANSSTRSLPLRVFEALNGQIILYPDCVVVRHNRSYGSQILTRADPIEYRVPLDTVVIVEDTPPTGYRRLIVRVSEDHAISLLFRREDSGAAHKLIDAVKDLRRAHGAAAAT